MSSPSEILNLIDSAVHGWETSPDIVFERRMDSLSVEDRADFTAYWQTRPLSFDQAWSYWVSARSLQVMATSWMEQLVVALESLARSTQAFARAFGAPPPHPNPCFCHQAPFPAARDYRRRTKHRNRRRKR